MGEIGLTEEELLALTPTNEKEIGLTEEELLALGKTIDPASDTDSGSESGSSVSVQDRIAQPNIVIPEIDSDAPLSSGDFYSIINEEKEEIKVDDKKEYTIPEAFKLTKEAKDKDTETLEAWLNEEYFGKGVANQAMGTDNITAYQINDPTLGDLKQDFKSNLGELGISRAAFENLSDSDLDDIFTNVFSAQVRTKQAKEGEADERAKINDILLKKEKDQTDADAIEVGVDRLDNAKINSYENPLEAEFAQNVKKLRGELTEEERERIENYLDPEFPGSLGDRLFNKDETIQVKTFDGFEIRRTGKRVPKDEKYEIYHNPTSGRNIKKTEARAIENNGGTTVNITDAYETYLASFKNTSQDDLAKYNNRLLLEESGYNIENKEVGNYYVGDKTMRNLLLKQGYESDKQGVFQDVPLGVLTQLSHVPGTWDFWSPDSYMSKGEIIPQDFENKPYENEEEFVEFLQTRRKQGNDIAAKNAALKQVYYLNRDPSTISKNRVGQFGGAFAQSLLGENITKEQTPITNQNIIDVIGNQIIPESGADITLQQEEIFERTFADEATEAAGGLAAMLTVLSPINKVQKALGINRMIAGLSAPRYVKGGKSITQSKAIKEAAKAGDDLAGWAKGAGYTEVAASSLQKGIGTVTLGIYEDFKMREVLGAVTDGRMEFERGVGFGFAIAPKVLPYGFGRFGRGKKYDLTHSKNQLNTFMQSTFVNAPSFALAVEGGDALGAVVKDIQGKEEYETWAKHHWSDRNTNMRRIGLNLITGKALGLMHFNAMDFKTTANIGKFQRQSVEFIAKDYDVIDNLAGGTKNRDKFIAENPNSKEVQDLQKHWEDFNLATQRLDMINNSAEWTDPAKAKKTYENHYKPLAELFKSKGKEIKIEVTDKPIYQEIIKNGKLVKQEVSALYTRLGTGKNKSIATIQINTKKAKGKQYANHEGLHAYLDLMFDGNIKMKEQFTNSFKEALKSIKTPNSNLYQDILKTKDIKEIDKLEEMMAYSAEYLGKAEYYNTLVSNQAFTKVKKFWNNFAESTLGHKADLTLKQDIIDLLGTYGKTGDIKKLEKLNEIIEYDPTGKAREGQVATTDINKTVEQIKTRKTDVLQEIKDLRAAKPKGYESIIKEKTELFNELNANQRKLENKAEIEKVDVTKKGWEKQIDKNYTGTYKTQKEFQASSENSRIQKDIMESSGLINMIRQGQKTLDIKDKIEGEFLENVQFEIIKRFNRNYNPGKINKKFGRALTPFEYLTTGQRSQSSIIYRAIGDVAIKMGKQPKTVAADAYEGGYSAFEGYSEQTGYMNTSKTFDSKIEREGIELSEQPAMMKKVGDKTLGEIIDQKSGADAKNLDFTAKGAKQIVSYKNIKPNAERTIGKEVTVDYYKVTPEMYKKMLKSESQQLNNPDIENILDVIKNNTEADLNMMPRWKQSIIDKHTGKEVAFDIVGGKFPSEPKATGTTTKILKLGQEGKLEGLIYKEIPQTGTKGSKYEYSKRYKEYLETVDQVFKTKFEQDVIEALSKGNRAEISGKLKGWMMQRKKAMYVQGVDKALPNTPELTVRFTLAEMANQLTAGKNPKLATKDINDLIKLIQKQKVTLEDVARLSGNIPGVKVLEEIIMERDALTKDVDVVKANEKYEMDLTAKEWKELEANYIESVSRSREIARKNGLSEKHADPNYIAKNPGEKINGVELAEWRKKLDAEVIKELGLNLKDLEALTTKKGQKNHHALESLLVELGFGSKSRKQTLSDGTTVYLNKEGRTSAEAIEAFLGEKFTTTEGKSASKYKNVYRPDWSGLKKKLDKLEKEMEGESIEDIKDAKIELYRKEASHSGESKDFEATEKANREFFEDYITAVAKVAYKNKNNNGVEYLLQSRAMQTNHAKGISKSLGYKMTSLNAIGSKPGEVKTTSAKGEVKIKDNKGISNHWEHALQLLNQTNRIVDLISKHKSITPKFKKGLKEILDISDQHLIPKNGQLFNDAKGPTTFTKAYTEMLKKGVDNPLLNVFANKYAKLENNFVVSGPNKGKSLLDVQLESLDLKIAKKVLSKIPEGQWGLFEYQLNNKIKNGKKVEIQNRDVLNKSIGKKMAKTVASKDINKVSKIVDKALENGRKINKESRGMSTWDFDDTLATTKSGVRATIPNPSGKPKPNRKVIFLAGGAGSGKGNVIKKLNLEGQGFKIVNSDISLEWLKKNNGLPENMNDLTKEQRSTLGSLQYQARSIAKRKMMKYKGNADGVVVDGTGGSIKSMEALVKEFKDKGYDVSMLFVETSLETALARNKARAERSLLDKIVEKNHEAVQGNKDGFKTMFGERFMEVKTDKLKQKDAMPAELVAKMKDFVSGYEKIRLDAEQFATEGQKILDTGGKFDFAEFNVVTGGEKGPFFQKALDRAKKFGTKDQFVLTARPAEAAGPIYEFLKSQGLNIPLENITGLGNSTGEAKALWMLKKFSEGYNDMYFADDAMQNVKAVRDVLNQLDIKSKVQQALASKNLNEAVNKIMEHSLDVGSEKVFSKAEAKVRGKDIKRRRVFMRDSAADLELLIEPLYGKGKEGIKNKKWFKEEFVMPFERGIRDYNTARQSAKNDYMSLRKQNKDVVKEISKPVEGTAFTNDMAMRVYLWNKAGYKIPDLAKTTEAKLVQHIASNPKLQAYAENFARITKQEKGLKEPGENWWGETMAGEVTNINRGVSRKQYLQEWIDAKNEIFTEENLNKMESKLGTEWRENITDMFDRMETGRTRSLKMDRGSAIMMNYLNGGIGTIMNFNTRSAVLQTISTTNFLNMRENNPIAAARAMGNVKQFAKDFKYIMNSDMLKQRRDGLAMNVTEAEIASAAASSQNPVQSIISKVLKAGYLPTKMADSFAISFGGATFYRNRIKMYEKQGMKTKEAEKQAFLDFQVIAERTQQSSRADLLSKQQTSLVGRFILPFANTPMQMNRAGMKDILDISKGRYENKAEIAEKVGRISYYMGAQVAIFAGLQSALFAMLLNDDDVSDEKVANTKSMMLNTTADSMLRGFGVQGAVMSATKNALQEYFKQSAKPGFTADYSEVAEDLLNISPPIGSKFGMLDRAGDRKKWAKIRKNDEFKFELGNPSLEASLMTIQATTNAPVYSPYQNLFNMSHALSDQYETWQRVLMGAGWTPYSVGVETEDKKKKKKTKKAVWLPKIK